MRDDAVEIEKRLAEIHGRYPELARVSSSFMGNYENAYAELYNAMWRTDSDIRGELMAQIYQREAPLDNFVDVGYLDDELTDYGDRIVEIRFCCGFIGNLAQGDLISKEQCAALLFAYEAYWREGEDYALGVVVENLLRRIQPESHWKWPEESAFKGREEYRQIQWLARAAAIEMLALARHHRLNQPGFDNFSMGSNPKPPLRDFRGMLDQINAAARAERLQSAMEKRGRNGG